MLDTSYRPLRLLRLTMQAPGLSFLAYVLEPLCYIGFCPLYILDAHPFSPSCNNDHLRMSPSTTIHTVLMFTLLPACSDHLLYTFCLSVFPRPPFAYRRHHDDKSKKFIALQSIQYPLISHFLCLELVAAQYESPLPSSFRYVCTYMLLCIDFHA
jgi:hypothetical protein